MKRYVFDLDNTLVYTDSLNNEAYNFALRQQNREEINNVKRITRENVFSRYILSENQQKRLISEKQQYFIRHLDQLVKNEKLIRFIKSVSPQVCVLWTRAEVIRVEAILEEIQLKDHFSRIFYSKKNNIQEDLQEICEYFNCNKKDLVLYDDEFTEV